MNLELLYSDENVEVRGDPKQLKNADRVMFSFTGGGFLDVAGDVNERKVARVQRPEFVGTATTIGGLIVVMDLQRSWGNSIDWNAVKTAVDPYIAGKSLYSIGNSMGGYLSILAGHVLPIKSAIAFAPQFSAHPEVVPGDERWMNWRSLIHDWQFYSLNDHLNPATNYYIFVGEYEPDLKHARCFLGTKNIHRYVFPGLKHGVAEALKGSGALSDVVALSVEGTFSLDQIHDKVGHRAYEMPQEDPATPVPTPSGTRDAFQEWDERRARRDERLKRIMAAGGPEAAAAERERQRAERQPTSPEEVEARRQARLARREAAGAPGAQGSAGAQRGPRGAAQAGRRAQGAGPGRGARQAGDREARVGRSDGVGPAGRAAARGAGGEGGRPRRGAGPDMLDRADRQGPRAAQALRGGAQGPRGGAQGPRGGARGRSGLSNAQIDALVEALLSLKRPERNGGQGPRANRGRLSEAERQARREARSARFGDRQRPTEAERTERQARRANGSGPRRSEGSLGREFPNEEARAARRAQREAGEGPSPEEFEARRVARFERRGLSTENAAQREARLAALAEQRGSADRPSMEARLQRRAQLNEAAAERVRANQSVEDPPATPGIDLTDEARVPENSGA